LFQKLYLKNIGGGDVKDFTTRICKSIFKNAVAEKCSLLGRKKNYAVGHLQIVTIAYGKYYFYF